MWKSWLGPILFFQLSVAGAKPLSDARLDLAGLALDAHSQVDLSGKWLFYPDVFLESKDFSSGLPKDRLALLVQVPGGLSIQLAEAGQARTQGIWGTYVLEFANFPSWTSELGLYLRGDTAYRVLLIDPIGETPSQLVMQAGLPGSRAQESIPQIIEQVGRFTAPVGPGPYYLVVQLSGFHYTDAGLWVAPILAPFALLERRSEWIRLSECLVVGMLLIMLLYSISLYFHRHEDTNSLWLSAFSATTLLRFIGTSGYLSAFAWPHSSAYLFESLRKIEFSMMPVSASCFLMFFAHTFQFKRLYRWLGLNNALVILVAAFVYFTDASFYPKFLPFIIFHVMLLSTLALSLLFLSVRRGKAGSGLALFGAFVLVLCGWYDVLLAIGHAHGSMLLIPYGMCALIFSQGQVTAKLFAKAFRTADRLSTHLAEEVERQTRDIRSMLEHIPQGLMNIIAPGIVDKDFSRHLIDILELDAVSGQTVDQVLLSRSNLNSDERSRVEAALASCLGDDALAFELNSEQFPRELQLLLFERQKILQLTWNPVLNKAGIIEKILVTCHDITAIRSYELELTEQRLELSYIQELVDVSADKFALFYETSIGMIAENLRLISMNRQRNFEILKILFVNMHTVKGAARSLGFKKMTSIFHDAEQLYAALLRDPTLSWQQFQLENDARSALNILEYYQNINQGKLGRSSGRSGTISVEREFLVQHTQMLKRIEHEHMGADFDQSLAEAMTKFDELAFEDGHQILRDICSVAEKIAKDLGKLPPNLCIEGVNCGLSFQAQQLLRNVMIHLIRNSLDHGIEMAEERVKHGKTPAGSLHIKLSDDRSRLKIEFHDDGRGLSLRRLERRGKDLGLFSGVNPAALDDLAELVFYPGLSTADSLSEVSGRGIGMDAVKRFIEKVGGSIKINATGLAAGLDYSPFVLTILLPSSLFLLRNSGSPKNIADAS